MVCARMAVILVLFPACYDFGNLHVGSPDAAADGGVDDALVADGPLCGNLGQPCCGSSCTVGVCNNSQCISQDVWAVGTKLTGNFPGLVMHWDGAAWSSGTVDGQAFTSVWGNGPNDVWA